MEYKNYIQSELTAFEKKFNIKIEDLYWIESLLSEIYGNGYESNDIHDYQEGYAEGYDDGYKSGYKEAEMEYDD